MLVFTFDSPTDGTPQHDSLVHAAGHEHVQIVDRNEVGDDVGVPGHLEENVACASVCAEEKKKKRKQ